VKLKARSYSSAPGHGSRREVGELIEHFQWLTAEQSMTVTADDEAGARGVSDELAGVLIYVVRP
jgi:hypothetical protein